MSLLFFDGFDNAATMPKPEWDASAWFNATGRDGLANGAVSPQSNAVKNLSLPSGPTTVIAGFGFKPVGNNAIGGNGNSVLFGPTPSGSTTPRAVLYVSSTGRIQLRLGSTGGTLMATGTAVLTVGSWNHIQVMMSTHLTTGVCKVYVNGVLDIDFTGQTSAVTGNIFGIQFGSDGTSNNFDDLWVCDTVDATATQGRPFNDFLGDLKVASIVPTAPGSVTQWTPSPAPNWGAVDENPPNQTDFVTASTPGLRDLYAASDLPSSATAVYALRVGAYAQKSDAGTAFIKPAIKEPVSGTVNLSAALGLTTTYGGFWGGTLTQKAAGGLWSVSDVNGAEIGVDAA